MIPSRRPSEKEPKETQSSKIVNEGMASFGEGLKILGRGLHRILLMIGRSSRVVGRDLNGHWGSALIVASITFLLGFVYGRFF